MTEQNIQSEILLGHGTTAKLFRNNTGMGWTGEVLKHTKDMIVLKDPRPLHSGLCKGSSDLIGWLPVVVTPEMVGTTVALFTAVEAKTKTGRVSPAQAIFIANVSQAGGRAGVARSKDDAKKILK